MGLALRPIFVVRHRLVRLTLSKHRVNVGQKLHYFRQLRRMSLRDVAELAGCSPSFLSQIEQEAVSPTVKSLDRICRALDVSPADFLREETAVATPIVRQADQSSEGHVAINWPAARLLHLLPPGKKYPFTALILQIDVGGSVPKRRAFFPLKEICVVLRGTVTLDLGSDVYSLKANDSIFFDLSIPHHWSNIGDSVAEILLTSPNSFQLFEDLESDVRWHVVWKRQKKLQRERTQATAKRASVSVVEPRIPPPSG